MFTFMENSGIIDVQLKKGLYYYDLFSRSRH